LLYGQAPASIEGGNRGMLRGSQCGTLASGTQSVGCTAGRRKRLASNTIVPVPAQSKHTKPNIDKAIYNYAA